MLENFLDSRSGRKFLRSRKLVEADKSNKVSVTSTMLAASEATKKAEDPDGKSPYKEIVVEDTASLKDLENGTMSPFQNPRDKAATMLDKNTPLRGGGANTSMISGIGALNIYNDNNSSKKNDPLDMSYRSGVTGRDMPILDNSILQGARTPVLDRSILNQSNAAHIYEME